MLKKIPFTGKMGESNIFSLPEEVIIHIGSFLRLKDLLACCVACSFLRTMLNDNSIWKRHYKKKIVNYLRNSRSFVEPAFHIETITENDSLVPLCEERINVFRQNHLLNNWQNGRSVDHEAQTPGNGLFLENNDRQIIYDNIYLFLHVLNTNEISIWQIEDVPYLYTSVQFNLYEYNNEDEDWTDVVRVWYQIVKDMLLIIQGNLVQVFKINLPDPNLPLQHVISVDRDAAVPEHNETFHTDCYSWIVGHLLFSRLCYLPVVHVWNILTGDKVKSLQAPTTGWDLYVISTDSIENVVLTLRTDDPYAPGPENYANISNHISRYNVARDEFTTLFPNLMGCKPVHAIQYKSLIVLFCIDDMFIFTCSIYIFDCDTCSTVAHKSFSDLVGLYKSRIVEDQLILATQNSVEILDVKSLEVLRSLEIDDIVDIDYLPVLSSTFIVTSSLKSEIEVWDVFANKHLLKLPLQSYVFLNESCSKLVLLSGQSLVVKNFW